jgi:hypothetical protein
MFSSFLKSGLNSTGGSSNGAGMGTKGSFLMTPPTTTSRALRRMDSLASTNSNNNTSKPIQYEEGTGALVYEGAQLDELFALLDSVK